MLARAFSLRAFYEVKQNSRNLTKAKMKSITIILILLTIGGQDAIDNLTLEQYIRAYCFCTSLMALSVTFVCNIIHIVHEPR